jgi:hypothetical protein
MLWCNQLIREAILNELDKPGLTLSNHDGSTSALLGAFKSGKVT